MIKTTVVQSDDPTGVHHYVVRVSGDTGKNCQAMPDEVVCIINGLVPATQYTFEAAACLNESPESDPCSTFTVGAESWTKPTRKDCNLIDTMFISHSYFDT